MFFRPPFYTLLLENRKPEVFYSEQGNIDLRCFNIQELLHDPLMLKIHKQVAIFNLQKFYCENKYSDSIFENLAFF